MALLHQHQHGKSRVRLGRVWRHADGTHDFAEWSVASSLESDMGHAFATSSNAGMTATDTQKNLVSAKKACGGGSVCGEKGIGRERRRPQAMGTAPLRRRDAG